MTYEVTITSKVRVEAESSAEAFILATDNFTIEDAAVEIEPVEEES